jgi:Uma2 family endonuclease
MDHSPYLFSVEQYEKMVEVGILGPDDKVELLEGQVIQKPRRDPPHDATISMVGATLRPLCPPGWNIRFSLTVVLNDSVTEPDLAFVRGDHRSYLVRHPRPADVGLLIEVATVSLDCDLHRKSRIYARSGIVAIG